MTIWELVILFVVGTVCVTCGIGIVYSSIVNTIERYQIRSTKRKIAVYTKVMQELPATFENITNMVEGKGKTKYDKYKEKQRKEREREEFEKEMDELMN